jgi:geranylgeranylglycerol-phosphate geranylgeranyltransferase
MSNKAIPLEFKFLSRGFLRGYVVTMRPYLLFVSGITGIAGVSFSSSHSLTTIAMIACASFFSYGFGQALTDCFQIDTDSISSPYRPLTQGRISRPLVLAVSGLGLAVCVLVFGGLNPRTLLPGVLAGIGLLTYTWFKRRWWGGPFYNAWIVAALCIMAFNCGTPGSSLQLPDGLLLAAVFFGYANFVLAGYFKDISADRTTGYRTLPVVFGRVVSAFVSDLFALLTILAAGALVARDIHGPLFHPAAIFLFAGVAASVVAQTRLHKVRKDEDAHAPTALTLHSYILLLSGLALSHRPEWFPALAMFYLAFVLSLGMRPEKTQI